MVPPNRATFVRRNNADGSTDSICKNCFATVATSNREFDLAQAEQAHSCDPHMLEYWNRMREHSGAS